MQRHIRHAVRRGGRAAGRAGVALATLLAVTAASVTPATVANAQGGDSEQPELAAYTITVRDLTAMPPELGPATSITGHGELIDEAGQVAGHGYGICNGIRLTEQGLHILCDVTNRFDDGDIHLRLASVFELTTGSFAEGDAAVIGGTGRYQNVTGSAHLTPLDPLTQTYRWDKELYYAPTAAAPPPPGHDQTMVAGIEPVERWA